VIFAWLRHIGSSLRSGGSTTHPASLSHRGSSRVEVTITPDADGSVAELRHHEMPTAHAADHEKGWRLFVGERLPAVAGR